MLILQAIFKLQGGSIESHPDDDEPKDLADKIFCEKDKEAGEILSEEEFTAAILENPYLQELLECNQMRY